MVKHRDLSSCLFFKWHLPREAKAVSKSLVYVNDSKGTQIFQRPQAVPPGVLVSSPPYAAVKISAPELNGNDAVSNNHMSREFLFYLVTEFCV